MNKRIQELAEQAGDDWDSTLEQDKDFLKKFAELLVRECMFKVSECESPLSDEYHTGFNRGLMTSIEEIKEHFGVER